MQSQSLATLKQELLRDISRWLPELEQSPRSTLWHGVLSKTSLHVEALLKLALEIALEQAGEAGHQALQKVAGGKPVEALTAGQCLDMLRTLDRQKAITEKRILSRDDDKLTSGLVQIRNDFTHGRVARDEGADTTVKFLLLARQYCESSFLAALENL